MKVVISSNFAIILLFLLLLSISCERDENILTQLEDKFARSFIDEFKNTSGEEVLDNFSDTLSIEIYEMLKRDRKTSDLFAKYFIKDDYVKAKLIMYYWHQELNFGSYDFENHLKQIYSKEESQKNNKLISKKNVKNTYDQFTEGDSIRINYKLVKEFGLNRIVLSFSPDSSWIFNKKEDLELDAILLSKNLNDNQENNFTYLIKVLNLNKQNVFLLGKELSVGKEITIDLELYPYSILLNSNEDQRRSHQ
jgi:hypothetical protein